MQAKVWLTEATRRANRAVDAPLLREAAIRAYRAAMAANRFLPPPRMLLVGPAKSGTHLLSDCVSLLPRTAFSGRHFAMHDFLEPDEPAWREAFSFAEPRPRVDHRRLSRFLGACPQGMFVTAHTRWGPVLQDILDELGYRTVLLMRDPRDMAVSLTKYVQREQHHFHHEYYTQVLRTPEERLMASIVGFDPRDGTTWPQPSMGENIAGYPHWRGAPRTLVVRFEDLVGERGGGAVEPQVETIRRIGAHLDRPVDEQAAADIAAHMYSRNSSTFRKGEIGDWRNHFDDEHRRAFKEVAGELLIQLGYEQDFEW